MENQQNQTLRDRAIAFIFSLPQYSGVLPKGYDSYMARHKDVRLMVDRLETEFKQVYTKAILNYKSLSDICNTIDDQPIAVQKALRAIAYSDNSPQ